MNVESVCYDALGGFPDFEDYELTLGVAVEDSARTIQEIAAEEGQ